MFRRLRLLDHSDRLFRRELGGAQIVVGMRMGSFALGRLRRVIGLGLLDHADRFFRNEIGGSQMLRRGRRVRGIAVVVAVSSSWMSDGASPWKMSVTGSPEASASSACAPSIGSLLTVSSWRLRAAIAATTAAAGTVVRLIVGGACGAFVFLDQRLPVGHRDLIIIGMDFGEGQEAVAVSAVVDEGGLERRLHARHLGKIDIAAKLFTSGGLEVEFFHTVAAQNHHPGFLRMGRIDQHFVGH